MNMSNIQVGNNNNSKNKKNIVDSVIFVLQYLISYYNGIKYYCFNNSCDIIFM